MADSVFDPNAAAAPGSGIFGLPHSSEEAALVILPVPWEATTSYGGGTSGGPAAILAASHQVDLFHRGVPRFYQAGIHMLDEARKVVRWNNEARIHAAGIIAAGGDIGKDRRLAKALRKANALSEKLNRWVQKQFEDLYAAKKIPVLVGGDHSTPFGALQAAAGQYKSFDILQFDAHSDTRRAFEGFKYSHASIMHNVLTSIPAVRHLVQVGIRDYCEEEANFCAGQGERVRVFLDDELAAHRFRGGTWDEMTARIIESLGPEVWISFDIDGLDPKLCPHTGTPVPGGLEFQEAVHVIEAVARSGRRIIGFDLNEVSPNPSGADEWDANVGARLLFNMCAWTLASHQMPKPAGSRKAHANAPAEPAPAPRRKASAATPAGKPRKEVTNRRSKK